jgi:hypothetical protein
MDISGSYIFDAPHGMVWEALQDPLVLASVVDACRGVEKVAEHEYTGILDFRAGTVRGTFKGTISLSDVAELDSYKIVVNGTGLPGIVKVAGGIRLEAMGEKTRMHYDGHVHFGGRMASSGQRILEIATKSMMQQSFQSLNGFFLSKVRQQHALI